MNVFPQQTVYFQTTITVCTYTGRTHHSDKLLYHLGHKAENKQIRSLKTLRGGGVLMDQRAMWCFM